MKLHWPALLHALSQVIIGQRFEGIETSVDYPGLEDQCQQALNTTVTGCPAFLGSISVDNPRLTSDQLSWLCTSDYQASLHSVQKTIANACGAESDTISYDHTDWPAMMIIDRFLYTYNLSCRKDSDTNEYCDEVFVSWLNGSQLTAAQNCSDCMLGVMQIQLGSQFGYDEEFEDDFKSLTSSCSATSCTIEPPSTYARASSTAASSNSATPVSTCSDPYTVQANDTCDSIATAQNVSTEALINAGGLSSSCSNLHAIDTICLPLSCTLYQVQDDDTCDSILADHPAITGAQLLAWNPNINQICGNLVSFISTYICVGPPGGSMDSVVGTPIATSTATGSSSHIATTPVPKPTQAASNSTSRCGKWHTVKSGDSCQSIADHNNISLDDFSFLNPGLNSTCGNLLSDVSYCVQAIGDISTYSGYPTVSLRYTLTSMRFTTTSASALLSAPAPSLTPIDPLPTAPGMVSNCKRFTDYVTIPNITEQAESLDAILLTPNINSCDYALSAYEVSLDDFLDWNPILANVTPCALQPGYRYCLSNDTDEASTSETIPRTSTSISQSTTPHASATKTSVTTPTPTQSGMVSDCNNFYKVASGDGCENIATSHGITPTQFYDFNTGLKTDCSNLWPKYYVCVGRAASASSGATQTTVSTTAASTTSANPSTPTPTQSGMVSGCNKFYKVLSGDGCYDIAVSHGITTDQLYNLNSGVKTDCSNLWPDYYVCVGSNST